LRDAACDRQRLGCPTGIPNWSGHCKDVGVVLPIGDNGWLISSTSPQYMPSFELNREVALKSKQYGFELALSATKPRGFGGPSQH
jgi:pyrimidine oxygenase